MSVSSIASDSISSPRVGIVLLNYNNHQDTLECLRSIQGMTWPNLMAVVVDNASQKESTTHIRSAMDSFTIEVELIENKTNLGFAAGNNVGMRRCMEDGCRYVLVLNNDTIVDPHCIEPLVDFWERHPHLPIGALTGKVFYYDTPDVLWYAGSRSFFRIPGGRHIGRGEKDTKKYQRIRRVRAFSGCFVFFSRDVLKKVGMFDESFFFGEEDIEYSYRLRKEGLDIYYIPASKIKHKVGRTRRFSPAQIYNGYMSVFLLAEKILPPWQEKIFRWWYKQWLLCTARIRYKRKFEIQMAYPTYRRILRKAVEDASKKHKITASDWNNINRTFGNVT